MLFVHFDRYEACIDVTDSDHKPVNCTFNVDLARVDELIRRQEYGKIIESNEKIRCLLEESHCVPDTIISTNNIILENQETVVLRIANNCGTKRSAFEILCEGQSTSNQDDFVPRASYGFPHWLEVCTVCSFGFEQSFLVFVLFGFCLIFGTCLFYCIILVF
jgi:hypothetical protein